MGTAHTNAGDPSGAGIVIIISHATLPLLPTVRVAGIGVWRLNIPRALAFATRGQQLRARSRRTGIRRLAAHAPLAASVGVAPRAPPPWYGARHQVWGARARRGHAGTANPRRRGLDMRSGAAIIAAKSE